MALSYYFFGINEFSTRLIAALSGIFSMILIYLIGKRKFNHYIGLESALILGSSLWFVLRTRSGNLDIPFLCFFLLSIYFALKSQKNKKYVLCLSITLAILVLIKTLIGFSALLIIFFIFIKNKENWFNNKFFFIFALLIFSFLVLPWYLINFADDLSLLKYHFFEIGMRQGQSNNINLSHFSKVILYLQSGLGRWFKLFILGLTYLFFKKIFFINLLRSNKNSLMLNFKKIINHQISLIIIWFLIFFIPFLMSSKTEVWHLIPIYPPLALITAYSINILISDVFNLFNKRKNLLSQYLVTFLITGICIYQWFEMINLVIPTHQEVSNEADISLKAAFYSDDLYLNELFLPVAVFYSQKKVIPLGFEKDAYQQMIYLLNNKDNNLFIINQSDLKKIQSDYPKLKILAENESYLLIR